LNYFAFCKPAASLLPRFANSNPRMPTINPPLWRVRDRTVFFLGTLHFGPPEGHQLGPASATAIQNAVEVALEIHPDDALGDFQRQRTDGSLEADLGTPLYRRFRASPYYQAHHENVRPPLIIAEIGMAPYLARGLVHGGVDAAVATLARTCGKQMRGLERARFQIDAILSVSTQTVAHGLDYILADPGRFERAVDNLLMAYPRGDENGLLQARQQMFALAPDVAEILCTRREQDWHPQFVNAIEQGEPRVFAVGSIHLVGADSSLGRLRQAGYELVRV
jgi:uncharacterized protein YbaP (TraB family)